MKRSIKWRTLVTVIIAMFTWQSKAGVVVGGTRLVYDGTKKESSLHINNTDKIPFLVQSWIDTSEGKRDNVPFIITPPLFRLEGGQDNVLRVIRTGGDLPEDRETLYFLNVKGIPSTEKRNNTLQIAIKTRIKFIYRPASIKSTPEAASQALTWRQQGNQLIVSNKSPFYLTFFTLNVNGKKLKEDDRMVKPFNEKAFGLPDDNKVNDVTWQIINDFGGASKATSAKL